MNLAFIVHHQAGGGGISPVVQYAAQSVAALTDWRVTVVFIHDPISEEIDSTSGVRYVGLDLPSVGYPSFLDWLREAQPDLVVSSHVGEIDYLFPFFSPDVLHVAVLHDSGRRYIDQTIGLSPSLDGVFAVARHIEDRVREPLTKQGFTGLLTTVHNGAVFPPFRRDEAARDKIRLIFIGGPDPFKGVYDTLPLLVNLKQIGVPAHLTLVGGVDEYLQRSLVKAGVADAVTWVGRIPHEMCFDVASQADIILILSRKEAFGMATIEAMAMGSVPIAYDIESGNREIIEDGKSGLLVPLGDISSMAAAIQALHQDRIKLNRLSDAARDRARSIFGQGQFGARMVHAIKAVMSHSRHSPSIRLQTQPPPVRVVNQPVINNYRRLSASLRAHFRRWLGSHPKLCYFILDRFY